jgi:gluconate kinase
LRHGNNNVRFLAERRLRLRAGPMRQRQGHFMPEALLKSQFAALELLLKTKRILSPWILRRRLPPSCHKVFRCYNTMISRMFPHDY